MLIKLKQGVGRLIRSETDKGIVCILDSRLPKYETVIKETIPIKNFVYSIDKVKKFVEKNNINWATYVAFFLPLKGSEVINNKIERRDE